MSRATLAISAQCVTKIELDGVSEGNFMRSPSQAEAEIQAQGRLSIHPLRLEQDLHLGCRVLFPFGPSFFTALRHARSFCDTSGACVVTYTHC